VLADEVSKELLIDASPIGNSSIPKCTPQLKSLQKNRLGLLITQILTQGEADAHGAKARDGNIDAVCKAN
jgi:hypothetical protein